MPYSLKFTVYATLIFGALFFSICAKAQSSHRFGIGLNAGPAEDENGSFAIGGDLRYQFKINKQFSIPLTIGLTSITRKDGISISGIKYERENETFYPIKLGIKVFLSETGVGPYGLLEGGIVAIPGLMGFNGVPLVISPALGYAWKNGIDIGIKYENYAGVNGYYGIRLGYGF